MARPRKPPRLWLRPARDKSKATWLILDGKKQLSTGCDEEDISEAQIRLERYIDSLPTAKFINELSIRAKANVTEIVKKYEGSTRGHVYFISANTIRNYPIKIGFTRLHGDTRFSDLQTGCPYPLKVLARAPGSSWVEGELHKRFRAYRLEGEWFARNPDLMTLINMINSDPDPNALMDDVKRRWSEEMDAAVERRQPLESPGLSIQRLVGRAGLEPATRVL